MDGQDSVVDYRCDDAKEIAGLERHRGIECVAGDSRIPKMSIIAPYKALVHSETAKNCSDWIVNSEPQLL
jgi:hypothetical protein